MVDGCKLLSFSDDEVNDAFKKLMQDKDTAEAIQVAVTSLHPLAELLGNIQSNISQELAKIFTPQLMNALEKLPESFRQTLEDMKLATEILANAGWTIPMHLQPHEIFSLIDNCTKSDDDFDEYFFKYYSDNTDEMLNEVFREIRMSTNIKQWEQLIDECISCYKSGYCLVLVPSLLSVIEGLLSSFMKKIPSKGNVKNEGVISVCKRKAVEEIEESLRQVIWISMYKFTQQIFKGNQDFNSIRPAIINRHWILHGRDKTNWKKVDVIRLFIAIHTLLCILYEPKPWAETYIEESS